MTKATSRAVGALAAALALMPSTVFAEHESSVENAAAQFTARDLLHGWAGLSNPWYVLDVLVVLGLAAALGSLLGYHPQLRRKAAALEQLDQPKAFIMYAMVGALSAMVGREDKNMAYVIFGIGGLMRFRTDVGEAKDTGRVILATMVGVLVGLKLLAVALLSTAFAWLLISYLEKDRIDQVMVQGIDREHITASSEAYRRALASFGCKVVSERKNVMKGTILLAFRAPAALDYEALERHFEQSIEREQRGSVDWESR